MNAEEVERIVDLTLKEIGYIRWPGEFQRIVKGVEAKINPPTDFSSGTRQLHRIGVDSAE